MNITARENVPLALDVIYSEIERRVSASEPELDESCLWYEFSCCLLSSQVPFPLAIEAANSISDSEILLDENISCKKRSVEICKMLSTPLLVDGIRRKYRFPRMRAKQLSESCNAIRIESGSLKHHIQSFAIPGELRKWLVSNTPGIGPKQASMFLRNICHSYDLAIMDRHVIDYMRLMGLYHKRSNSISSLSDYHVQEKIIIKHAAERGYCVGILDWAIWIVMRQLKSIESGEAFA